MLKGLYRGCASQLHSLEQRQHIFSATAINTFTNSGEMESFPSNIDKINETPLTTLDLTGLLLAETITQIVRTSFKKKLLSN